MNDKPPFEAEPFGPDVWEAAVQRSARAFPYPPTPDLVPAVRARLASTTRRFHPRVSAWTGSVRPQLRPLAWAFAVLLLVITGLFAVPQVRARIVEFLQVGAIRIFVGPATPSPTPLPTATRAISTTGAGALPFPTPVVRRPTATPLASVLDLAGETSLEAAQRGAGFTIRLPAYPTGLGPPTHVFLQQLGGPVVVLVWTVPGQPENVRLSLHEFGPGTYAEKFAPTVVRETTVNGSPAVWTQGAHLLVLQSGDVAPRELVHGHTLIWQQGRNTYRLETGEDLEEAIRIAESVR